MTSSSVTFLGLTWISVEGYHSPTIEPLYRGCIDGYPRALYSYMRRSNPIPNGKKKGLQPLSVAKVVQLNVSAADFKIAQADKSLRRCVEQARQPFGDHDKRHEYLLLDDLLYRMITRNDGEVWNQLVVSEAYRSQVLGLAHDTTLSCRVISM